MPRSTKQPLVSVIVPVYNIEKFITKCLDSILSNTYRNIELIVVNDGSPGNIAEIVEQYKTRHDNIKFVNLKKNVGLFRARIEGGKVAKGEYITHVDGDDTISVDYLRLMVAKAQANKSDIVIAETVVDNNGHRYIHNLLNELPFESLNGKDCFAEFMNQRGENYVWHTAWGKLYSRRVWQLAFEHTSLVKDHIIMTEDILHAFPIWFYAKRVDRVRTAYYYYYKHDNASTVNPSLANTTRSIANIAVVFDHVEKFLQAQGVAKKYQSEFHEWADLYAKMWHDRVGTIIKSKTARQELLEDVSKIARTENYLNHHESQFYKVATWFDPSLDNNFKKRIISNDTKYISFDLFDTLVVRPFIHPTHIFKLMNSYFKDLEGDNSRLIDFYEVRVRSEQMAREVYTDKEDVVLDQIYAIMQATFNVKSGVADKLKKREIAYELRFLQPRQISKELFDLAKYLGKEVIVTTDMYLPKEVLEAVLTKCGYDGYKGLYISNETGVTKSSGRAYDYIAKDLSAEAGDFFHIGDNMESDYIVAREHGWNASLLQKTTDALNTGNDGFGAHVIDKVFGDVAGSAYWNFGLSVLIALTANKFFDNPYANFHKDSSFNCSPEFIGYFGLGTQALGLLQWLDEEIRDSEVDNIIFLARDGWLPMKAYDILHKGTSTKSHYLPTSRKAIAPLSIFNKNNVLDLYKLNFGNELNRSIVRSLGGVLVSSIDTEELLSKVFVDNKEASTLKKLALVSDYVDMQKVAELQKRFRETYSGYFDGKVAVFDIGYSGKPEQILTRILDKPIKTLFMYANTDEPYERLGNDLAVYSRFNTMSIRELMISEPGPSCVGYDLVGDKVVPVFDKNNNGNYYTRFVMGQMQKNALQLAQDLVDIFDEHVSKLYLGDKTLAQIPINNLLETPTDYDRQIFKGILHEDDMGMGSADIYDKYYDTSLSRRVPGLDGGGRSKLQRIILYARYDRRTLKDKLYHKAPAVMRALRPPYRAARKAFKLTKQLKRRIKS